MLVRLMPDDIAKNWKVIKYAITESMPPQYDREDPDVYRRLFDGMMTGELDAWALVSNSSLRGMAVTTVGTEFGACSKNLIIVALYLLDANLSTVSFYKSCIDELKEQAQRLGCRSIIGYTVHNELCGIAERLGGNTETRVVKFEV